MPIIKNTARQISVSVRLSGTTDGPYVAATWPDSAVAKMYYSKDGATPVAIIPTRIDATTGGWLLAVATMTAAVWNCDELRVFWEGTGILSGSQTYYPEADYTTTVAGRIDAEISSRSTLVAADIRTATGLATASLDTQLSTISGYLDTEVAAILAAVDTEVAAIKAKTDSLPASPAAVGSAMTLATGAITAATIATDAIDADAMATSAITEIATAVGTNSQTVQIAQGQFALAADDAGANGALEAVLGDTRTLRCQLVDGNRTPVGLTGATLSAALVDLAGTVILSSAVGADNLTITSLLDSEGRVQIVLPLVDTDIAVGHRYRLLAYRTASGARTSYPLDVVVQG